jgi:hypothetical protein
MILHALYVLGKMNFVFYLTSSMVVLLNLKKRKSCNEEPSFCLNDDRYKTNTNYFKHLMYILVTSVGLSMNTSGMNFESCGYTLVSEGIRQGCHIVCLLHCTYAC